MEEETIDIESDSFAEAETEHESEAEAQNNTTESLENINLSTDNSTKETFTKTSKPERLLRLPFTRIKHIMKMDPDVSLVQLDAVFLVAKATEMFIEYVAKETNKQLVGNKRKTVMKRDIDATIESTSHLCFLDGALE